MLKNPNLEADWGEEESHDTLFVPDNQVREVGNIFTPPGWLTWIHHVPGTWDQPEVRDARTEDRVLEGEKALLLFTFSRNHDAGFLQQVPVVPGTTVRLTAWAHAWSNHKDNDADFPHPNNPAWSEGAGFDKVAWEVGTQPSGTGDPQIDARTNFAFVVGLDPTGGTNPLADTVVWGTAYHIYNWYVQELSVEATAEVNYITVFLRSRTSYPFKHNDAYWDKIALEMITPPRGAPRIQYERTYVLLPPSADSEWALAVIAATWDDLRYTVGSSADDAGIGDLDSRKIIAINPDGWPTNLEDFYEEHYPGVELVLVNADTPEQLQARLSPSEVIIQGNPKWANLIFCGSLTLKAKGCWHACCAMAQRHFNINTGATPATVAAKLKRSDYSSNCSMLWSAMPKLGLQVVRSTTNLAEVKAHLANGNVCFAEVSPASLQHFVFVTEYGQMLDPLTGYAGPLKDKYPGVDSWRLVAKAAPLPPELPPAVPTIRGVHDEAGADWLLSQGLEGYCTIPAYVGTSARKFNLLPGIKYLINLRYSYAVDDGGQGTMPAPEGLAAYKKACLGTMQLNPQAAAFIYCNEMNNSREWPAGYSLEPGYYVKAYNSLWLQTNPDVKLIPGAIDPYNPGWGDWRVVWKQALEELLGCEGIALHTYTHGRNFNPTQVFGDDPLKGVNYNLRVLEDQQAIIPTRFRDKPMYVTETNHLTKGDGSWGWDEDAYDWVIEAYEYFSSRGIVAACLFRYGFDQWNFDGNPSVLRALKSL